MSKIINEIGQWLQPSEEDKRRRQAKVDELVAQDVKWLTDGRHGRAALEELLRTGWRGYDNEPESTLDERLRRGQEMDELLRSLMFDKGEE